MVTQDERFDRLDASIERIDARMARTDASIERIDARMARTDALIERMDARMERTDVLIERMDARMERMDARMERMDASIERFSQHTDDRFDSLTKYILDLRDETSTRLRAIESRLDLQAVHSPVWMPGNREFPRSPRPYSTPAAFPVNSQWSCQSRGIPRSISHCASKSWKIPWPSF